jgi:hypothetical protein
MYSGLDVLENLFLHYQPITTTTIGATKLHNKAHITTHKLNEHVCLTSNTLSSQHPTQIYFTQSPTWACPHNFTHLPQEL